MVPSPASPLLFQGRDYPPTWAPLGSIVMGATVTIPFTDTLNTSPGLRIHIAGLLVWHCLHQQLFKFLCTPGFQYPQTLFPLLLTSMARISSVMKVSISSICAKRR